jgi:hypothetical protein
VRAAVVVGPVGTGERAPACMPGGTAPIGASVLLPRVVARSLSWTAYRSGRIPAGPEGVAPRESSAPLTLPEAGGNLLAAQDPGLVAEQAIPGDLDARQVMGPVQGGQGYVSIRGLSASGGGGLAGR